MRARWALHRGGLCSRCGFYRSSSCSKRKSFSSCFRWLWYRSFSCCSFGSTFPVHGFKLFNSGGLCFSCLSSWSHSFFSFFGSRVRHMVKHCFRNFSRVAGFCFRCSWRFSSILARWSVGSSLPFWFLVSGFQLPAFSGSAFNFVGVA